MNLHDKHIAPDARRRWFRFSLRTLLIVVTLLAIWLGFQAHTARRQATALRAVQEWPATVRVYYEIPEDDEVVFDFEADYKDASGRRVHRVIHAPDDPSWLTDLCGTDLLHSVQAFGARLSYDNSQPLTNWDARMAILESFPRLRQLYLGGSGKRGYITNEALHYVRNLRELEQLTIEGNKIDDEGLTCLSRLSKLRTLCLRDNDIRGEGLPQLAGLSKLNVLRLALNPIHGPGLQELAPLERLTWLELIDNQIDDDGLRWLPPLKNLEDLSLDGNRLTGISLDCLAPLEKLTALRLSKNPITDEGLAKLPPFRQLTRLELAATNITDAGLEHLKRLPRLESVDLSHTQITDAALQSLMDVPTLRGPTDLRGTKVTAEGIRRLRKARPNLRFWLDPQQQPADAGPSATTP